jgi:hypothetical protein
MCINTGRMRACVVLVNNRKRSAPAMAGTAGLEEHR